MSSGTPKQENDTDSQYIESDNEKEQEYVPPTKNEITEAIYKKYNPDTNEIFQQDENDDQGENAQGQQTFIFKIKNLDTGEQQ